MRSRLHLGQLAGVGKTTFKKVTPLAGAVGAAADFAKPMGDYSFHLSWVTALVSVGLLIYWLGFRSKKLAVSEIEKSLFPKVIVYSVASALIFTSISVTQATAAETPDRGIIASKIPALGDLQRSLFRLEQATKEMNVKLDRIEDNVNQLQKIYTLEQIQKLVDQEIWDEAIKHLGDIDPLKREDEWQRLLETSVYNYMKDLARLQNHQKATEVAKDVFEKYKTLKKSDRAMELRNKIGLQSIKACLRDHNTDQDCHALSIAFIEYDEKYRGELGFKVGKMTTYHRFHRWALPFFLIATEEDASPEKCQDERLASAVLNAIGPSYGEYATMANTIADRCFPQLKRVFVSEIESKPKGTGHMASLCGIIKKNGAGHKYCKK